jgi:hypothetical protein
MDTFEGKVYTINTSLNERTIYIKIIDTIQYLNYEGNIELKEFRMPITLQDAYMLLKNCFAETKDHSVSFSKNTNVLRLDFKAKIGGYMNIGFEFILRETAIGDDARASMRLIEMDRKHKKEIGDIIEKLDKMEQHYDTKIESLESIIENQQNMIEIFGNLQYGPAILNGEIINVTADSWPGLKYSLYYNCKKLTLTFLSHFKEVDLSSYKNINVEQLVIDNKNGTSSTNNISYNGLQNMPSLKQFIIKTTYTHINSEGPIEKSSFIIEINNISNILSSYKHNINEIILEIKININMGINTVPTLLDVNHFSVLRTYCKKNNIDLIVQ